jgi:integrase
MDKRRVENWYEIRRRGRMLWLVGRWSGERVRLSLGTDDPKIARARALELWSRVDEIIRPPVTMDQLAEQFAKFKLPRSYGPTPARNFMGLYRKHHSPEIGRMPVRDVTPQVIERQAGLLASKALKRGSQRMALCTIRMLLRYAVASGLIDRSPWSPEVMPRLDRAKARPYSDAEIQSILEACRRRQESWVVQFLLATGLRRRELTALGWDQVLDLPHPALRIDGKGDRRRVIRLIPWAIALLAERRGESRPSPLTYTGVGALADRLARRVGFQVSVHRFRHTFACKWVELGGTARGLQDYFGHETIRTTEIYEHLGQQHVDAEVARLFKP